MASRSAALRGPRPLRFFTPRQNCVPSGAGAADAAQIDLVATLDTSAGGRFAASVPYRTDDGPCATQTHGNELFAFAETAAGEVALVAPGRAEAPGTGLEPGMILRNLVVLPRVPQPDGATVPVLTSVARVAEGNRLVLYLGGFGLLGSVPFTFELTRVADGARQTLDVRLVAGVTNDAFGPFAAYAPFRRFGASLPYVARAMAFSGSSPLELSPGEYTLRFGDATEQHSMAMRIGAP